MNEIILIYCAIGLYIANLYRTDIRSFVAGRPNVKALPGAKPTTGLLIFASVLAAFVLLGNAVIGEYALGIVEAQSEMVWFFVFASVSAGVIEEVVFRGYLVVQNRGRNALVLSCLGFSLVFALVHGYLWNFKEGFAWNFEEGGFAWNFTVQGIFNTWILFFNSVCFYALRFGPWNANQSLLPSIIAHMVLNLGVFGVKLAQGYILF
jgi:membrane protease YdiL (CAAX protease family)